jgi:hypothetical protein
MHEVKQPYLIYVLFFIPKVKTHHDRTKQTYSRTQPPLQATYALVPPCFGQNVDSVIIHLDTPIFRQLALELQTCFGNFERVRDSDLFLKKISMNQLESTCEIDIPLHMQLHHHI